MTTAKNSDLSGGCLAVIGLPFLLAGLGIMLGGFRLVHEYHRTASWAKVDGRILACSLDRHRGSKTGTTYSISGSYEFEFRGRRYHGRRISLERGSSSGYELWNSRFELLERHRKSGEPIPVLVDPKNPDQSVIFRDVSPFMLILPLVGGVFLFAGFGLIGRGIYDTITKGTKSAALAKDPQRPWRAERLWTGFIVHSGSLTNVLGSWGTAIFATLFVSIFVIGIASDQQAPPLVRGIVCLFTLMPIFLLGRAGYATLQYLKYGRSTLMLSQIPFVPGGELSAVLVVRHRLVTDDGVKVTLKCEKKTVTGSGKQQRVHTEVLHHETQSISKDLARPGEARSAIPLRFRIPAGLPSRDHDTNPSYHWTLEVVAETPGIDFGAEFDLPVYRVTDTNLITQRTG